VPEVKAPQNLARFEGFHLDLRAGELRQGGGKTVRLPEQPFQILIMLLRHPGEVVTREELRRKLWPNDTIVEFEHSISAAMNRLRQALGDSADSPRYIETLARRGYRWKVPVEWVERRPAQEAPAVLSIPQTKPVGKSLIGKLVSHYRVLEVLGGGGMGIVYQAEDIKLGRRVALKFLPEELACDPVMLERFEREARATSSLDHPNICAIYEIEEHEGKPFIVMQLLDGRTLRERIINGTRLTTDEVLDIALQIVEGLDAAHKKGIIHRDIKPANIFLTKRDEAKILDFGLAKLELTGKLLPSEIEQLEGCRTSILDTPTVSYAVDLNLTKAGERIGTACYMSPEQVRGETLDARTDLFSLGLVIYEMSTAHQAFPGDTASVVHNAILYRTPTPVRELNPDLPAELAEIIGKCLEKDRESRYHSAAEPRRDLKALKQDFESSRFVSTVATTAASGRRWPKIAFALLLMLGVAVAGWLLIASRIGLKSTLPPVKVRPLLTNLGVEGRPAFSPDGGQIAFMWNGGQGDQFDIYVKLIDEGAAPVRVTKSPGAFAAWPVWSPDGHRLAFFRCSDRSNGIFVVPVLGGRERRIAELRSCPDSLDWSPDGRLLAFPDQDSTDQPQSIFLVSLETGGRRRLTTPIRLEQDSVPNFSRDGKTIAFVRSHGIIVQDIFLVPVDGGQPRRLTFMNGLFSGLTWTPGDKEVIFSNQVGNNNFLWRIKASGGTPERVTEVGAANASEPVITRQGNRLAYRQVSSNVNIWQIRLPTSKGRASAPPVKLISSTRSQDGQQYSPDGKKIVFVSDRSGSSQIWICDSDGSNPVQITSTDAPNNGTPRWSPDGRSIVFDSIADNVGVYLVPADGGTPRPLVVDSHLNAAASFSRDGRWVYFVSDRSGEYQVWKVSSDGGQPVQVTFHGGWHPMESADGKFLYYLKTSVPTDPSNTAASLWRMPVVGGEEHMVIPEKIYLHWAVGPQGIFFIDQGCQTSACPTSATKPGPSVRFFDIATGRTAKLATLEKQPSCCNQSLTVSPDGRSILYGQEDSVTTDIMLVENFR
jgi:eukaryotic-like serine/threonine-protein kinase